MTEQTASQTNIISRSIQHEDVLLSLWLIAGEPLIQWLLGMALGGTSFTRLDRSAPHAGIIGLIFIGAILAAAIGMATRSPGPSRGDQADSDSLVNYAYYPMGVALGMVAITGCELLGLSNAGEAMGIAFLYSVVISFLRRWLPSLDSLVRRILMTPFILVAAWIFSDLAQSIIPAFLQLGQSGGASVLQALGAVSGFILLFSGVLYMMFVFAPRRIASDDSTSSQWTIRYALYLASVILNLIVPKLLAGG